MTRKKELQFLAKRSWRLNNLYKIIDKTGQAVQFKMNWCQESILNNLWYLNVVLKARQLGVSTFSILLMLDTALMNSNQTCGIIADSRETAEKLFKKIRFAYENLPSDLKALRVAEQDSIRELSFSNGSSISVGTSMRGQTLNNLLVSEFGKMCAKYRDKAEEVVSGSLNSLAAGQFCMIESTAEGREGYFYRFAQVAEKNGEYPKTKLDWKLHFFPWWQEPGYKLENNVLVPSELEDYFQQLEEQGIMLSSPQKNWYIKKAESMGDLMFQEFPSLPEESFWVSNEGSFYGRVLKRLRHEGHYTRIPYEPNVPVHTAWDLGLDDYTAIWYVQLVGREVRVIDYDQYQNEGMQIIIKKVKDKPYTYGKHIAPHDIKIREYSTGQSRIERAKELGIYFDVAENMSIEDGIDSVRSLLPKCYFDEAKCLQGITALENYSKEWDQKNACWRRTPRHDSFSHAADAFRYLAVSMKKLGGQATTKEDVEKAYLEALQVSNGSWNNPLALSANNNYH